MAIQILGSINIDLIASVAALPRPGETVLAHETVRLPGGKGANQAVAAARMGGSAAMLAAVGRDEAGGWMIGNLRAEGVDVSGVQALDEVATGTAFIAVDASAENQIIVAAGANARIEPRLLLPPAVDTRVLLAQLEVPVATILAFFTAAGAKGRCRLLNAAPALPEAAALFAETDILVVNQHELVHYLGRSHAPAGPEEALAARALLTAPDQVVVVTLGAGGAVAVRIDGHFHAPAVPVVPVDTIGAGDCFVGALAALLDEGRSVEAALPVANVAAALCTLARGAAPAMPRRAAVEAFLDGATEHARTIKKREGAAIS
ncbi:ribokinase [Sphingomonas oleivorans]|uniref:Ribokinase n=1 Tax=Sphingomonas oleivorans TaxID=1735121 RepID=A0A2T5FZ27_9SPHN|nr:ribokinase [Sphingomonas oleivorans]PTQ11838.1 ribokinase [Sphingomonas oleivorans]